MTRTLRPGTGDGTLGASIVLGQRRPGISGMDTTVQNAMPRATIDTFFIRDGSTVSGGTPIPFPDKFKLRLPSGFQAAIVGSDILNTNETNDGVFDKDWLEDGTEVDLPNELDTQQDSGDKKYITINFRKGSNNATITSDDIATLNSGFAIEYTEEEEQEVVGPSAGKAMEFVNADGSVAKTVYCAEDNATNVQVYTKEAVDEKVGSGGVQMGDSVDRTPCQVLTVHGVRHPIGYEGAQSSAAIGINTVKVNQYTTARATSHYFKIEGNDLIDMTLVDGGETEANATIKGAIKDGVIRFMLPSNIYVYMNHSALAGRASTAGVDYYDGASWHTPTDGIVDYDLNENGAIDYTDFPYIALVFKAADNSNFTDATAEAIGDNTYIVPLGPITINGKSEQVRFVGADGNELSLFGDGDKTVDIPTVGKVEQMISSFDNTGIIGRNKIAVDRILAARKHYDLTHTTDYPVINHENNFCIAHGSDFHVDVKRLENFRDFVDGVTSIDAAIITGDFTSNGTDTEFNAMMGVEFEHVEPMRCIGNHERDGGKTLAQIASALDMDSDYYVNDDFVADYGIRFIVLNRYDVASTTKNIANRDGHWSQTQIDWFIGKLDESITNGYHVIVAMHAIDNEVGYANLGKRTAPNNKGFWQRMNALASNQNTKLTVTSGTVIEDIIAAFRTGGNISQSYTFSGNNAPQISVSHTFSGAGKFIAYMVGHSHCDITGYAVKHPDQLYLVSPVSGCMGYDQSNPPVTFPVGTQDLDLPRVAGTKTEDCFNIYAFDLENKLVKIVRIGADMNDLMEPREVACFEYQPIV